jgi:hypothetical protein
MRSVFLAGLKGEDFFCEARVLDAGDKLFYGTAECRSLEGKLLTHHSITYIPPPT